LILVAVVIAAAAVVVDKVVRAVLPGASHRTVTGVAADHPQRTPTPTTPETLPGGAPVGHNPVAISAVGETVLGTTGRLPPHPARYLDGVEHALAAPIVFADLEATLSTPAPNGCASASTTTASTTTASTTTASTTTTSTKSGSSTTTSTKSGSSTTTSTKSGSSTTTSAKSGSSTTISTRAGSNGCLASQDPPAYAGYLRADGINVVNSANDHVDEGGATGVSQTSAALQAAGIVQAGLPNQIGLIADGGTKVAFADFAPYTTTNDLLDRAAAKALIAKAKTLAPVVIVYMYAGAEGPYADHVTGREESYLGQDRGDPEAFAKGAIDDGASAVIASGPQVLRGMQFYKGHLIAYSLGDFAGYDNFSTAGDLDLSGILHLTLSPRGAFVRGSWTSLLLDRAGTPAVDATGTSARFVNELSVADFGSNAAVIGTNGSIVEPASG
jgi:hypothetical protein